MSRWPSVSVKELVLALERKGWRIKRQTGSHRVFRHDELPDVVVAFHDKEEIGPSMLARIAKKTNLRPEDF